MLKQIPAASQTVLLPHDLLQFLMGTFRRKENNCVGVGRGWSLILIWCNGWADNVSHLV